MGFKGELDSRGNRETQLPRRKFCKKIIKAAFIYGIYFNCGGSKKIRICEILSLSNLIRKILILGWVRRFLCHNYGVMAREKNKIDTIQITLAVTEPIRDMLESLSLSGFFGKNAADTAAILLREKLRELYNRPQTPGAFPAGPGPSSGGFPGQMPAF